MSNIIILAYKPNIDFNLYIKFGARHGRDCMVVGFTTTYAVSAYHR
jgi:hypothetical protein